MHNTKHALKYGLPPLCPVTVSKSFPVRYNVETMVRLHIQLLGTFQVLQNDRPVTGFRTDKIRALLAYLAVESDRPHRRDSLAGLFWPDMDDQKARYNLRLSLHRLRQTLGADNSTLQVDWQSVRFDAARAGVDVLAFTQAMMAVTTHPHPIPEDCSPCMAQLETAVALYHGDFLPGFFLDYDYSFAEWLTVQRERLHQEALQALSWLAEHHLRDGRVVRAIPYARRQLELEPWRESAHRQMMHALAVSGQRTAALNQYETCRRILNDELGIEPATETTTLYQQIKDDKMTKRQEPALSLPKGDRVSGPQPVTLSPLHPITSSTTPFIGRREELDTLDRLLSDPAVRLATITGAGGMGKTRLALAYAESRSAQLPHGICFVSLTAVAGADQISPAIAKSLAFTPDSSDEARSDTQQLLGYLQTRQLLLVLDNFEQLLDNEQGQDSMIVLQKILRYAPQVKLLITSRERLHMQAEQLLPLGGLPCPETNDTDILDYAAVQLFQQSARRLQPNFRLQTDDLPHLIAICRLLDGMPLGLELAAVWVDLLPLAEIAAEIQNSLDFLTADIRDWPDRHRSMRAVFDASWMRLSRSERELFEQISLFRGGFTRAAARAVAGGGQERTAILRLLSSLVSKSLLRHDRLTDRYTIHELLKQYGAEKLRDARARARHGRYYCTWLAGQSDALKGERQKAALAAIAADMDNIRAAWEWAISTSEAALLQEAAFSLGTFFYRQGRHQEGAALFNQAVTDLGEAADAAGRLTLARLMYWQAMFEPAAASRRDLLQLALALLETTLPDPATRTGQAAILLELGIVAQGQGQHETAARYFEQSLTRSRLAGDRWGEANVLYELGVSAWGKGAYTEAAQRYGQSLAIRRALQDHVGTAFTLEGLAGTAMFAGDVEQAIVYTEQSLAVYRQLEDPVGTAKSQAELGNKNWYQNLTGIELIEDSLRIFANLGTRRHLAHWTVILAMYKADVDIAAGELLAREGLNLCREIGYQRGVGIAYGILSRAAWLAEDYGAAQELAQIYLRLTEEMSMPLERSDALTWSAWAYLAVGQWREAESQVRFILGTPNSWQVASLTIAAILLVQRSPDQCDWAWQLQGYGEKRYGRHRGVVSQQMLARFLPAAMKAVPQSQVSQLKKQGEQLTGEIIFPSLLAALA